MLQKMIAIAVVALGGAVASADRARDKKKPTEPPVTAPKAPEPAAPPEADTPWGKGVSDDKKSEAERLLVEGNQRFVANEFKEALAKYEQAVAAWEHPAIRFNMVRTLIALDRPMDALKSLEKALAYGKGPLEDQMYTEALNYQRLLESQIATIELICKQPGVDVKVDGQRVGKCPGAATQQMLPGNHVVVGSKAGYLTQTKDVVLLPGKRQPIVVELITIEMGTTYETRWKVWKPWAVTGGGAALAGLGVLFALQARSDMDKLAARVGGACSPTGCTDEQYAALGFDDEESRASLENTIGIGLITAGGAVLVAGVVGVIMNRPRPVVSERREPTKTTALVPTLSPHHGGVALIGRF